MNSGSGASRVSLVRLKQELVHALQIAAFHNVAATNARQQIRQAEVGAEATFEDDLHGDECERRELQVILDVCTQQR